MEGLNGVEAHRREPLVHVGAGRLVLRGLLRLVVREEFREGRIALEDRNPTDAVARDLRDGRGGQALGQHFRQRVVGLPERLDRDGAHRFPLGTCSHKVFNRELPRHGHCDPRSLSPPAEAERRPCLEKGMSGVVGHLAHRGSFHQWSPKANASARLSMQRRLPCMGGAIPALGKAQREKLPQIRGGPLPP